MLYRYSQLYVGESEKNVGKIFDDFKSITTDSRVEDSVTAKNSKKWSSSLSKYEIRDYTRAGMMTYDDNTQTIELLCSIEQDYARDFVGGILDRRPQTITNVIILRIGNPPNTQ